MKNKRLTYLLFPVVAAIWGYAIYKYFFEAYGDQEPAPQANTTNMATHTEVALAPDTFSLLGNYRDPFLGKVKEDRGEAFGRSAADETKPVNTASQPPKAAPPIPPPLDWSIYTYNGLIQRSGTTSLVGILRVKGKSHFVNVGSMAGEAEVLRMTTDSIQLQIGEAIHTIGRR